MIRYARLKTPLGTLLATAAGEMLTGLYFEGGRHVPQVRKDWKEDPQAALFGECARQLDAYLAGNRQGFDLPLAPEGTPFQERVWREIPRIPYGETITYAALARPAGSPRSARPPGAGTGPNP